MEAFCIKCRSKKSRIQETVILSTCADSSTDTKTDAQKGFFNGYVSGVTYHVSFVLCYLWPVTNATPTRSLFTVG